ncbi:MAG: tRNA (N6-isopentenyl adenosine(37)-C2)-methylthiotransferase MiaB [Firmicutes bacterium]|nr:tRNA (N6-isopentenyl adenosine(37)-C2)-methylthiotransferase MiaB [Bacillota bacterium]
MDGTINKRPVYDQEGFEEAERQRKIIEELKTDLHMPKKFFLATMGCQMNARDSEKLKGILHQIGSEEVPEDEADLVIYNTCCVRENAEQKVFGRLGALKSLKRKNPNLKIVLCGCMMQENFVIEKIRKAYPEVDLILGTYNLYRFPSLLQSMLASGENRGDASSKMIIDIWKEQKEIVEDLPSIRKFPFKASVNIMYGCDNFCTYCIVPYVRGRERSRKPQNIIAEIEALAQTGVKEIQLLGQNVNSYGKGLDEPITFAQLLRMVCRVEGIERVRFMTSHPKDLSDELIDVMAEEKKICPQFHLPLQSGSDRLLKAMNRHYTQERYLDIVRKLKAKVPDVSITTDIIVGFPTETREDFLETLKVVREVRYDGAFTFIYSPRVGTPAASMPQVDPQEAKKNFSELLKVLEEIGGENHAAYQDSVVEVLAEEKSKNDASMLSGRSAQGLLVHFTAPEEMIGKICRVSVQETTPYYLIGALESEVDA